MIQTEKRFILYPKILHRFTLKLLRVHRSDASCAILPSAGRDVLHYLENLFLLVGVAGRRWFDLPSPSSPQGPIAPSSLFDSPAAQSAPGPPPPPPPPGPPPVFTDDGPQPQAAATGAQHAAMFAQLNQGMDITKGRRALQTS